MDVSGALFSYNCPAKPSSNDTCSGPGSRVELGGVLVRRNWDLITGQERWSSSQEKLGPNYRPRKEEFFWSSFWSSFWKYMGLEVIRKKKF